MTPREEAVAIVSTRMVRLSGRWAAGVEPRGEPSFYVRLSGAELHKTYVECSDGLAGSAGRYLARLGEAREAAARRFERACVASYYRLLPTEARA